MAVMCAEFANPDRVTVTATDRCGLKEHCTPPPVGWKIWIGNFVRQTWPGYFVHNAFSFIEDDIAKAHNGGPYPVNTQTTTYVVGQLYIHVMSSTYAEIPDRWRFDVQATEYLRVIWPPSKPIVWPPSRTLNDQQADYIAGVFGLWFDREFAPSA